MLELNVRALLRPDAEAEIIGIKDAIHYVLEKYLEKISFKIEDSAPQQMSFSCKPQSWQTVTVDVARKAIEEQCLTYEELKNIEKAIKEFTQRRKETTQTILKRILPDYALSETAKAKISEWIKYKTERKEPYKEQGLKSLLKQFEKHSEKYGDEAVCDLIDECMASNWKGIIFDRLKNTTEKTVTTGSESSYDLDKFKHQSLYGDLKYEKKKKQ